MNYLITLKDSVSKESYINALKTLTNWANGNLMNISRIRLNNLKQHGDADYVTADTHAGEAKDEFDRQDHTHEVGHVVGLTLTKRGGCFASIRKACMEAAEDLQVQGFDKPRTFAEYIESRITGIRSQIPTKENIAKAMEELMGMTEDEVKVHLTKSYEIQAGELEDNKAAVIAEDGAYEDDIDFEEAVHSLRTIDNHRMRTKVIDGLLYEVDRLMDTLKKYPNYTELMTKRHLLLGDAMLVENEMLQFEKDNAEKIRRETSDTKQEVVQITRGHQMRLDLFRQQQRLKNAA